MPPDGDLPAGSVEMRRRILALVESYPGLHLREIQRRAATSAMLAEYHLNILEKMGLVASEENQGYRNFFPARHAPLQLTGTDRKWLALLRRPLVLGMVLSLLETGPTRALQLARAVGVPASTALYQVKAMRQAGLVLQGDTSNPLALRLADPARVLDLLRTYHPLPDALTEFGQMWAKAIQAFALEEPPPPRPADQAAPTVPPAVERQPGSVQIVHAALQAGPLTSKDLCLETGLGRRTVYSALTTLRGMGLVEELPHLQDMRQTRFRLKP